MARCPLIGGIRSRRRFNLRGSTLFFRDADEILRVGSEGSASHHRVTSAHPARAFVLKKCHRVTAFNGKIDGTLCASGSREAS